MKNFLTVVLLFLSVSVFSQADHSHKLSRSLKFPDIPGYITMKCDFHQHTVFSDGSVWPDIRVKEALMDGLDAISLTEHLEYQPHKADIPHPDRNRSYEIAVKEAKDHALIIVRGSEITRRMPPGHNNAIFISDANKLLVDDSIAVFREAKKQNAFVFWNHPNWISQRKDGIATLTDMHRMLISEKLLHGIEVVNDQSYSDEALRIALDNNLTIMGSSDIHKLIDWDFGINNGGHRPITLVFCKEKTQESIQDALFNRRTVVFYKNLLIGRDEFLLPLIQQSITIKKAKYSGNSMLLSVDIENTTNAEITLMNKTGFTFHSGGEMVTLKAGETTNLLIKTKERLPAVSLSFEVISAINEPGKHPRVTLKSNVQE